MQKNNQPSQSWLRGIVATGVITVSLLSTGCANVSHRGEQNAAQTPEKIVATRSEARANAFIKAGTAGLYPFLTPAYRTATSLMQYQMRYPQVYKLYEAKVLKVDCPSNDSCDVQTEWTYQLNSPVGKLVGPVPTVLNERWIKVDNQWWYYQKN